MTTTARTIARTARIILGRPASQQQDRLDGQAADAIRAAAVIAGLSAPLARWAPCGASLTVLARAYLARYGQAYGLASGGAPDAAPYTSDSADARTRRALLRTG